MADPILDELNQLRRSRNAGDFLSMTTIPQAQALGQSWQKAADSGLAEYRKRQQPKKPISLGNGVYIGADGQSYIDDNYQSQIDAERAFKREQAQFKADAAQRRAETMTSVIKPSGSEVKEHREAMTVLDTMPSVMQMVQQNPDAFGAGSDATTYMPDWTPNLAIEGTKNYQQSNRSPVQQRARNAVFSRAYQAINALAGAALSQHEQARIEQFLPSPNDDAQTIISKLNSAMIEAQNQQSGFAKQYPNSFQPAPTQPMIEAVENTTDKEPDGDPVQLGDGTWVQFYTDGTMGEVR